MASSQPLFALLDDEPATTTQVDRRKPEQREENLARIAEVIALADTVSGKLLYEIAGDHWRDDCEELERRGHAIYYQSLDGRHWSVGKKPFSFD
jgi:hypothetical protein